MLKSVRTSDQLQRLIQRIDWSTLRFDDSEVITVRVKRGQITYVIPPEIWKRPNSPFGKESTPRRERVSHQAV
jgi:hypothetical protein